MSSDFPRIQSQPLSLDALLAGSERADCGALAIFAGTVRDHHQGRAVVSLSYSAYAKLAERLIREIEQEIAERYGVAVCRVVHRVGALAIGDTAILAIARGAHRAETFAALRALVEAVKQRAPIWKEEFYADGSSAFVAGCALVAPEDAVPAESRLHCVPAQSQSSELDAAAVEPIELLGEPY